MTDKKKILMICDHPLVPSGVGTQAKYLIEGLLKTGDYKFFVLGGAVKHPDYRIMKVDVDKHGEDGWQIKPVDGYGDKKTLREILISEKPDALLLFTDPRFFVWVWEMEDEIRQVCPILYWHVWDNDPAPKYNRIFYESTDWIAALSLKTYGLLQDLKYERTSYIPHAVAPDVFKPLPEEECQSLKREKFGPHADKEFIVFWNNRNARRKMTGDVIATFAKFAEKVGKKNVALAMHTSITDPEGQNIAEVARNFEIDQNLIVSEQRVSPEDMNRFYNMCDVTVNIANNEGFGLGTLESLMAGSPILVHMTGGLQFQIGDWWDFVKDFTDQEKMTSIARSRWNSKKGKWWGIPVFSSTRSCTGSQPIPYIYDDRIKHEDVVDGLVSLYNMGRENRRKLGAEASVWARKAFDLSEMIASWDSLLKDQIDTWKNKKDRGFVTRDV